MSDRLVQLREWMLRPEDEHLEFKEAKARFDFELLVKYCCALANERGGHMVLGVTDKRPRKVVGSRAFSDLQRTKFGLVERLRLRVDAWEVEHLDGRVIVFEVPSRPLGVPLQYNGAYWMRGGESVVGMTLDQIRRIFEEATPDFTAEIVPGAGIGALDLRALKEFRLRLERKSKRADMATIPVAQLLVDTDLAKPDGGITYAALALLGSGASLTQWLPQAEIIFEYRTDEAAVQAQVRREFREGLLLVHDGIWQAIAANNTVHSVRDGLFRRDIPAFDEDAVREALLNAVCHRDYRLQGSSFIRQSPTRLQVESPGGFPHGVSAENILFSQEPRNRRLAEALARCGLVERSGQGADLMFRSSLRDGKPAPDFSASDAGRVQVVLSGVVQDEAFLRFLERVAAEKQRMLHVADLVVLDAVHRGAPIPVPLQERVSELLSIGVLERIDRKRVVLSRSLYVLRGRAGEYTRRRGLDRETRKELLVRHVSDAGAKGAPIAELLQVLPEASRGGIRVLLRELRSEGRIHVEGVRRAARWFVGPAGATT